MLIYQENSLTIGNLPFLENPKYYNVSRDIGTAKITSCVVMDKGVALILGDSAGYLSIFINEDNVNQELRKLAKPELAPGSKEETADAREEGSMQSE